MSKRFFALAGCALILGVFAGGALAGPSPSQKCAAAKMNAAGKKYAAKAKCYAKALGESLPVDQECLDKAEGKFLLAFAKAESKGGCNTEGDDDAIELKIDQCIYDVVGDLGCGNGIFDGDEQCDDGNIDAGDGCSPTCQLESICGNGSIESSEECDDGNMLSGDGCDGTCSIEPEFTCAGEPSLCSAICGDGLIRGAEACDDANTNAGDGCSSVCQIEFLWGCSGEPSVCEFDP